MKYEATCFRSSGNGITFEILIPQCNLYRFEKELYTAHIFGIHSYANVCRYVTVSVCKIWFTVFSILHCIAPHHSTPTHPSEMFVFLSICSAKNAAPIRKSSVICISLWRSAIFLTDCVRIPCCLPFFNHFFLFPILFQIFMIACNFAILILKLYIIQLKGLRYFNHKTIVGFH